MVEYDTTYFVQWNSKKWIDRKNDILAYKLSGWFYLWRYSVTGKSGKISHSDNKREYHIFPKNIKDLTRVVTLVSY